MSALGVAQPSFHVQIAYQQQETTSRNTPVPTPSLYKEIAYQQQEIKLKSVAIIVEPSVSDTVVSGGIAWVKIVCNVLRFAFAGKSFLFDGKEIVEWKEPGIAVIYPVAVENIMCGGLKEDATLYEMCKVYGKEMYVYENTTGASLAVFVDAERDATLYLIDDKGNVISKVTPGMLLYLRPNWVIVGDRQFRVIHVKVGL